MTPGRGLGIEPLAPCICFEYVGFSDAVLLDTSPLSSPSCLKTPLHNADGFYLVYDVIFMACILLAK